MTKKTKVKKYHVTLPWFASVTVTVEAKNLEDALEKAVEIASPSICHQCSSEVNLDGGLDYEHLDEDCVWEGKNENT